MNLEKGNLFFQGSEWIISTPKKSITVNHDNIKDFGLKKNGHYYRCCYNFNSYKQLCIWSDELELCLSKSFVYDVMFEKY